MAYSAIFTDYHSFTGSVTTEDSDAAGQRKEPKGISKETKEKCNTESDTNEEQKAVFSLASDTDSIESLEMHSKSEHDTDSQANEDPSKAVDATDGLPTQRTLEFFVHILADTFSGFLFIFVRSLGFLK